MEKFLLHKICVFLVLSLVFAPPGYVAAQYSIEAPSTTHRCASVGGSSIRISTVPATEAAVGADWIVGPGLIKVAQGEGPGTNQYWVDVQSTEADGNQPFCPASVTFRWRVVAENCTTEYLAPNQVSTTVFKTFTDLDLDERSQFLGYGPYQIYTETPPCISSGDEVVLSVRPLHFCVGDPSDIAGVGDLPADDIEWITNDLNPVYQSEDNTSRTYSVTEQKVTYTISVRMGRCNTSPQVSRAFNQTPAPSWIGVSGAHQFSTVSGANANPGYGCLGGAVDGAFSLQVSPDQQTGSQGYNWVIPQGFTCAPPCTTRLVTITPNAGAQAASGQILCRVDNGQCGRSIASFNIVRPPTTTTLNRTGARTVKEPVPTAAASWPSNCYYPDIRYRFTWPDAPINNTYTWTTAQWSWTNSQGQGTPEFSGIPAMEAPGTAPLAQTLTATSTGPNLGVPALATCTSTVSISGYKATDFTTTGLRIRISGSTLDIVTEDGTNNPNWFNSLNPSCTTSLSINDYYYEWGYIGTYNGNTNPEDDPSTAFNASAFGGPVQGQGLNQTGLVNPSLFSTGSKIYCRIRRKSSTPSCTDASLNCFYRYVELALD